MGASLNKVQLIGRLGKDPEIRKTTGGKSVANFSIATDETYKDTHGEKQKKTEWHNIVVWGNSVENFIEPYIHMGDMVYVEGKLQTRQWTDKEGNKKYTTEINATDIKGLVTQRTDGAKSSSSKGSRSSSKPTQQAAPEVSDEDIPF
jgi:single-strand DNA-binding protein